jgi:hypothetical protein
MKCEDPKCAYCKDKQTLVIPFRVRMSFDLHTILRRHHKNVSEYIRDLILDDLHRQGLAQKPVKYKKFIDPWEESPFLPGGQRKDEVADKPKPAPDLPDFNSMVGRWL